MDYIDYDEWVDLIIEVAADHSSGNNWLDISCGTASMAIRLVERGYSLHAVDLSPEMVERARNKAETAGITLQLFQGDMRQWQAVSGFDVVLNVHDGLNYLLEPSEIHDFMLNTHSLLKPEGIVICDVATPILCQRHFRGYHELFADEQGSYERITGYDSHTRIAETSFNLYSDSGEAEVELHRQRAYDLEEIQTACDRGPFSEWDILDNDTLGEVGPDTERILLILRRSA